ncbi:DMT family transporter [Clostridium sp. MSJ-11]|uniref:DMT family transporter n=1 Tax=Clostridium mobile TaxID=2841512 RepID=A0ABS6EJT0_9CLOT|nr:DMT family transporter [Clostridium mobile]MBU5485270.1 DMT family transporter [Clostridium mobile]
MINIMIAFITGALVILSMVINSSLGKKIGVLQGTFINYIVGLIGIAVVLLIKYGGIDIPFGDLQKVPLWAYLGGAIGVIVVATSNIIIPKIPTIYSTLLIFIGQLGTGIVIDYLTMNVVSKGKIIGSILILLGLVYNFYIDKKELVKEQAGC